MTSDGHALFVFGGDLYDENGEKLHFTLDVDVEKCYNGIVAEMFFIAA